MPTGGANGDAIAPYPQRPVVHLTQRHPFQYQVSQHVRAKPVDHRAHPAQVAQAFLAHVGDQPDIARQRPFACLVLAQRPGQAKQTRQPQGVIADPGSKDLVRLALDLQIGIERKDRIQVRRNHQRTGSSLPRYAAIDIAQIVARDFLQPFHMEPLVDESRPLSLAKGRRRDLLDGDSQIEHTRHQRGIDFHSSHLSYKLSQSFQTGFLQTGQRLQCVGGQVAFHYQRGGDIAVHYGLQRIISTPVTGQKTTAKCITGADRVGKAGWIGWDFPAAACGSIIE